jgi:AcrR family transcriptional regulator
MTKVKRGPRADGEVTRARILDVAGMLFSKQGYANTPSKLVCEVAEVDLAAINYHFDGREGLYRAVILEGHKHFIDIDSLDAMARQDLDPREKLGLLIDALVASIQKADGWHMRVCAREMLAPSSHFQALMNEQIMPKFLRIAQLVSAVTHIPFGHPALIRSVLTFMAPLLTLMVVDRETFSPAQQVLGHPSADLTAHLKLYAFAGLDAISAVYSVQT